MIIVNNNYNNKIQKEIRQEIIKGGRREQKDGKEQKIKGSQEQKREWSRSG